MEINKLYKISKFYAKEHGLISLYMFIPILITLLFSAAVFFSLSSKQAEFFLMRAENVAVENVFMQAEAVCCDWFEKAVVSREIEVSFADLTCDNPVISLPKLLVSELAEADKAFSINAYFVDENYSLSWASSAGKLGIPQIAPVCMYSGTDDACYVKRYMFVCELSKRQGRNPGKYVFCREILVSQSKGELSVKPLYCRKDYVLE